METALLMAVALVALLALSWYLLHSTKHTRGAGSWGLDRLLVWTSGFCFAGAIVTAVHLVFFLLR